MFLVYPIISTCFLLLQTAGMSEKMCTFGGNWNEGKIWLAGNYISFEISFTNLTFFFKFTLSNIFNQNSTCSPRIIVYHLKLTHFLSCSRVDWFHLNFQKITILTSDCNAWLCTFVTNTATSGLVEFHQDRSCCFWFPMDMALHFLWEKLFFKITFPLLSFRFKTITKSIGDFK